MLSVSHSRWVALEHRRGSGLRITQREATLALPVANSKNSTSRLDNSLTAQAPTMSAIGGGADRANNRDGGAKRTLRFEHYLFAEMCAARIPIIIVDETAPGSSKPIDRSPSLEARPRVAIMDAVDFAPATAAERIPVGFAPVVAASAAGCQASSMVFCPGAALPLCAMPSAMATMISRMSFRGMDCRAPATLPARRSAVA